MERIIYLHQVNNGTTKALYVILTSKKKLVELQIKYTEKKLLFWVCVYKNGPSSFAEDINASFNVLTQCPEPEIHD